MHILVSFCNLRAPGVPALGLLNAATLEFHVLQLPPEVASCNGITGLALSDRYVYVVAWPSESMRLATGFASTVLLIFNRRDLSSRDHYAFRAGRDVHNLWVCNDFVYAVSTGTDDIMELRLRDAQVVSERCFWRPDPDGPREDVHHLNAIYNSKGELFVSGFGKKASEKWNSARDGFITNISRGETLTSGIDQPHSLTDIGGGLAYCESRKLAVRSTGDARIQYLPGYTRSLCTVGDRLFVGTSMGRQVSKSTGSINNPAETGAIAGQCTISRLSIATFEIEQTIDMGVYAQEIYELLPVDEVGNWPIATELAWRNASIRELARALDQRKTWAKQTTSVIDARDATICDLQSQVRNDEALQNEVAMLRQAADQQAAQLEAQARTSEALQNAVGMLREGSDRQIAQMEAQIRRSEALQQVVAELHNALNRQASYVESVNASVEFLLRAASYAIQRLAPEDRKQLEYIQQSYRIHRVVAEILPADATVAVVSKGDDDLLRFNGRSGWHFPQDEKGVYPGFYPANSAAAIAYLEALRAKGADFLVLPRTAFWWLDHYTAFKAHLESNYRLIHRSDDTCLIYALCQSSALRELSELIAAFKTRHRRCPGILNWQSGMDLAGAFPECAVFAPMEPDKDNLPYFEQSVDIVAVWSGAPGRLTESLRVASEAVVIASPGGNGQSDPELTIKRLRNGAASP